MDQKYRRTEVQEVRRIQITVLDSKLRLLTLTQQLVLLAAS